MPDTDNPEFVERRERIAADAWENRPADDWDDIEEKARTADAVSDRVAS